MGRNGQMSPMLLVGVAITMAIGVTFFTPVNDVVTESISVVLGESTQLEFSDGTFNGTETSGDSVQLSGLNTSGTYESGVISDGRQASFSTLRAESTVPAGTSADLTVSGDGFSTTVPLSGGSETFSLGDFSAEDVTFSSSMNGDPETGYEITRTDDADFFTFDSEDTNLSAQTTNSIFSDTTLFVNTSNINQVQGYREEGFGGGNGEIAIKKRPSALFTRDGRNWTIMFWFKFREDPGVATSLERILEFAGGDTLIYYEPQGAGDDKFTIMVDRNLGLSATPGGNLTGWTHVALTFEDNPSANDEARTYVNGTLQNTNTFEAGDFGELTEDYEYSILHETTTTYVDEFGVYKNASLTQQQIQNNVDAQSNELQVTSVESPSVSSYEVEGVESTAAALMLQLTTTLLIIGVIVGGARFFNLLG